MFKKAWDVWWKQWTWPLKIGTVLVVIIVVGLIVGGLRSCGKKRDIKVDHDAIQKVNSQNRAEVKKEVRELVEENADIIEVTNDQTTLTEVNAIERDRIFEEKVREVDKKIQEAKAQDGDVSQEDLQCILVPSDCP